VLPWCKAQFVQDVEHDKDPPLDWSVHTQAVPFHLAIWSTEQDKSPNVSDIPVSDAPFQTNEVAVTVQSTSNLVDGLVFHIPTLPESSTKKNTLSSLSVTIKSAFEKPSAGFNCKDQRAVHVGWTILKSQALTFIELSSLSILSISLESSTVTCNLFEAKDSQIQILDQLLYILESFQVFVHTIVTSSFHFV